jgi:hypothetical protein
MVSGESLKRTELDEHLRQRETDLFDWRGQARFECANTFCEIVPELDTIMASAHTIIASQAGPLARNQTSTDHYYKGQETWKMLRDAPVSLILELEARAANDYLPIFRLHHCAH